MSPRTAAVVLWFGLAVTLPLPLLAGTGLGWWPLAKWAGWAWGDDGSLPVALGVLMWGLALAVLAVVYRRVATGLPPKWPGALVGLTIWVLLVVTATVPVYRTPEGVSLTFMDLYGSSR